MDFVTWVIVIGGLVVLAFAAVGLYSLALQKKAVATQDEAVSNQREAIERSKRSLELQESTIHGLQEIVALQKETNKLLRDVLAKLEEQPKDR